MTSHFGHVFLSPDPYNAVTTRAQTHMVWQICSRQKGNFTTPVTFMNSHFDLVLFPYSVQSSCVQRFATPWTAAHQASLSIINSQNLLKLMSIKLVMPSNDLVLCRHPFLLLPSVFPSIRIFSNKFSLRIRWPKYCSFSITPFNEYSGLISLRIDRFDLLAFQGTLKSLLQHHNSKASILKCSAFFMVQFSHLYMTTGKNIALTIQTVVGKVMSLLFNKLSRLS